MLTFYILWEHLAELLPTQRLAASVSRMNPGLPGVQDMREASSTSTKALLFA